VIALAIIAVAVSPKIAKSVRARKARRQSIKERKAQKELGQIQSVPNGCALSLRDIVKIYGDGENKVKALDRVSVNFRKSEFVSVLGPSGCGKTTMLNIIGGLDRYTDGDLIINGVSTKTFNDADWDTYRNNSIGFVFQSYNLIPHQTILSNVELALTLSGVSAKERHEKAKLVLKKVGLEGLEHKRPNQLSGGQMQRVAIARALVNDPDIILADEPTGALDTETSIQIMDLLKEVARDRLVIMVTHNPELAKSYSTRIINLLDGKMTGDTNPLKDMTPAPARVSKKGKAQMKLKTAFSLSLSNLRTKKGRTTLTSIAGSIGIIGIAMVLAVSSGFSAYVNQLQSETLSVYPLTISESVIDLEDFEKLVEGQDLEKYPTVKKVFTEQLMSKLTNMLESNKITDEYVDYVESYVDGENAKASKTSEKWRYSLQKDYGFNIDDFVYGDVSYQDKNLTIPVSTLMSSIEDLYDESLANTGMNISTGFVASYIPTLCEMPKSMDLINSQYDVLEGKWAEKEDEFMLVVDESNSISDITLALLGFRPIGEIQEDNSIPIGGKDTFTFEEIMEKEFYYLKNDTRYTENPFMAGTYFDATFMDGKNVMSNEDFTPDMTFKITGIARIKKNVQDGVLDTGLAYTSKLKEKIIADNLNSAIVETAKANDGLKVAVGTKELTVRQLAGSETIAKLSIYNSGYDAKEEMKAHLEKWNEKDGIAEDDKVHYSDSTATLFSALNIIVDAVKIVLICFTAISLVVSSIMIGIITYVSVVERTKEIGVLRSLGARKKDISRIFNAETFLVGLFSGLIGIAFTYLVSIPINVIVAGLMPGLNAICALNVLDALVLVVVSFALTLIAGIIPSRIAAKKDPVVALRSE